MGTVKSDVFIFFFLIIFTSASICSAQDRLLCGESRLIQPNFRSSTLRIPCPSKAEGERHCKSFCEDQLSDWIKKSKSELLCQPPSGSDLNCELSYEGFLSHKVDSKLTQLSFPPNNEPENLCDFDCDCSSLAHALDLCRLLPSDDEEEETPPPSLDTTLYCLMFPLTDAPYFRVDSYPAEQISRFEFYDMREWNFGPIHVTQMGPDQSSAEAGDVDMFGGVTWTTNKPLPPSWERAGGAKKLLWDITQIPVQIFGGELGGYRRWYNSGMYGERDIQVEFGVCFQYQF